MKKKPRADDWDNDINDYMGTGSVHDLNPSEKKKPKRPIGFVIFPEKEKARKVSRPEVKRGRKR